MVKYPKINIKLAKFGGDQINAMSEVMEQLRNNSVSETEIAEFNGEIMSTESATQFLNIIKKWVNCTDFAQFSTAVYDAEDYFEEEVEVIDLRVRGSGGYDY